MDIRVLRYFLAVAREQNISRAAQVLNLTQPTLSTQLKALEEELGCQLLVRGGRKVTLTDDGMVLRKRAQEILDLVSRTEKELSSSRETVSGDIAIGTGETSAFGHFANLMRSLQERYPGIHYKIFSGNSHYVVEQLERGLVDFGLLYDGLDVKRYDSLRLPIRERWGVLLPPESPLASKSSVTASDLRDQRLIISQQEGASSALEKWFGCPIEELDVVARYNLVLNAAFLTKASFGLTLTFEGLVDCPLVFRPLEPELTSEATLVWKKYQVLPRASEVFLETMMEGLSLPS